MMKEFEEQRLFPRASIRLEAHVQNKEQRFSVGVVDLTVHGISFQSAQIFSVGSKVIIEIEGCGEIKSNELTADILRCDPLSKVFPPQYAVAAKFTEVNDEYLMDALALVHGKKQNLNA